MKITIITISVFLLSACHFREKKENKESSENIRYIKIDDNRKNDAIRDAQSNLKIFIAEFKDNSNDSNYSYYVKSKFVQGNTGEHMWSYATSVTDNKINAVLDNDPITIHNIKAGAKISLSFNEIEDWKIYYKDSTVAGSYFEKYFKE